MILLLVFAAEIPGLVPLNGMTSGGLYEIEKIFDVLWHMVLPCLALILMKTAGNYLLMRQSAMGVMSENHITVAVTKGLKYKTILRKHVMKNALLPYLTSVCIQFGYVLSGAMLIEVMFSWKGMGSLMYSAVQSKDYPVIQISMLIISFCVIISNIIADILCVIIDPRIEGGVNE